MRRALSVRFLLLASGTSLALGTLLSGCAAEGRVSRTATTGAPLSVPVEWKHVELEHGATLSLPPDLMRQPNTDRADIFEAERIKVWIQHDAYDVTSRRSFEVLHTDTLSSQDGTEGKLVIGKDRPVDALGVARPAEYWVTAMYTAKSLTVIVQCDALPCTADGDSIVRSVRFPTRD